MRRLLIGYAISLLVGIPLGIFLAKVEWLSDTVGSVVLGLQTVPSVCWLPIALIMFGQNDGAILFVVVMGALLAITVAVQDGVRNLPPSYLRAARTMGTLSFAVYTQVILPATTPAIVLGAKLGWSFAWRSLMAGELLYETPGLGHLLNRGRQTGDMSQVVMVMLTIVVLGLITDKVVFATLETRVRERWGLSQSV